MDSDTLIFWNVWGLNARARRDVVASLVAQEQVSILCVQETKLHVIDDFLMLSMICMCFGFSYLLAGMRGGILVAWRRSRWASTNDYRSVHALMLKLSHYTSSPPWWLTMVYGPSLMSSG
jgi:hypothetical protein